jgi:dCTP diphosphatase
MKKLLADIKRFNELRDWRKFHDPRSLILALCSEVGELAHIFRWRKHSSKNLSRSTCETVEGEIADIFIFLMSLCIELDINPEKIVRAKMEDNEKRFPVSSHARRTKLRV